MGLKCKIVYRDGQAIALNDNGQISPLYLEALELYKDEKRALNIWGVSQSEEFQDAFGITPEEAILQDVVTYLDTMSFTDKKMSPSDKIQVNSFMVKNGIESLSDLNKIMSETFKQKGFFQFDEQKMVDSGLWKPADLPYARQKRKQIQDLLSRIEGELITNDYTLAVEESKDQYRNSANKTIFGTSEIIDGTEIARAIKNLINNFQDTEEFYAKIKELPYDEYVDRFYNDEIFAKKEIEGYKQIKKIPVLSFVNNELSADNNETYTTLKNTLLSNVDGISVEANLSYLQSIPSNIWSTSQTAIKEILKEIEESAIKLNIDIVGLSTYSNQREEIIGLLSSLNNLLQSPTEANIQSFSQTKDTLIAPEDNTFITETLPDNLMSLNIVRLDSNKTDNELFEQNGLIKIGDSLYHKVHRGQISELYDYLYNQVVDGAVDIPVKTKDTKDKPAVLKEISEYVNARATGIVSEFQEEISLNQLVFEHKTISQEKSARDISQLPIITTDTEYLKTEFISDFYNYILEEKLNNSEVYRDVLSHFTINDRDISLQGTKTPNVDGIKFEKEFRDYARLKRDVSLKEYTEEISNGVDEDLYALNFPEKLIPFRGEIITDGNYAILNPTNQTYVKFNNKLYRRAGGNKKVTVFQEIKTKPSTVYYTTNLNFETDKKAIDKIIERYPEGLSVQEITYEQKQENLKKARMTDGIKKIVHQAVSEETLFNENLVEFIRQKGVQVITDPQQFKAELEDSNAMISGEESLKNLSTNETAKELAVAIEMKDNRFTEREIKLATGWEFDDITGKWKYELDTSGIQTKEIEYNLSNPTSDFTEGTYKTTVSEIIDYPELFEAYPKLKDMRVVLYKTNSELNKYDQLTDDKAIFINLELYGTEENRFNLDNRAEEGRKGILHELQHNISTIEGFARGGNPSTIAGQIRNVLDDVRSGSSSRGKFEKIYRGTLESIIGEERLKLISENTPEGWVELVVDTFYNNLTGEVESRNVEHRINMSLSDKRASLLKDTEKIPRKEQIFIPNYLQTPAGNILGFEKNGIIYLDETQLNETTTLHELIHIYQSMLDIKAVQGDEIAQQIIAKRGELFGNEAEYWVQEHQIQEGVGKINPMIISEQAAERVVETNELLQLAKKMEAEGEEMLTIERTTGWYKDFDQWRYFSKDILDVFNIKNNADEKLNIEQNLENVIGTDNPLFTYYPNLRKTKVEFYEGEEGILGSQKEGRIMVNTRRSPDTIGSREYLGGHARSMGGITSKESIVHTLAHETSHRIQFDEKLLRGGSTSTILDEARRITGEQRPQIGYLKDAIEVKVNEVVGDELFVLVNALYVINEGTIKGDLLPAFKVYQALYGEAEARSIEYIKMLLSKKTNLYDTTFTELQNELLKAENLTRKDLIPIRVDAETTSQLKDTIGLDLSSEAYTQRPTETREQWHTRMIKEVEAYVTAPTTAEKLETLRKENPSLWQQITDYINQLTNWLKTQIGLTDYQGDIMSMTREEYINALGVSILKDKYDVLPSYKALQDKYNSTHPFKTGEIEIIYHHTEAQHEEVMKRIDECSN